MEAQVGSFPGGLQTDLHRARPPPHAASGEWRRPSRESLLPESERDFAGSHRPASRGCRQRFSWQSATRQRGLTAGTVRAVLGRTVVSASRSWLEPGLALHLSLLVHKGAWSPEGTAASFTAPGNRAQDLGLAHDRHSHALIFRQLGIFGASFCEHFKLSDSSSSGPDTFAKNKKATA